MTFPGIPAYPMRRNKKNVIDLMLSLTRVLLVPPNENKMSRRERERAWLRMDRLNSGEAGSYGGSRSAPSHG
jgi:hypothetical protein